MGALWRRRPLCTSIHRDPEKRSLSAKFGRLFSGGGGSNPSTPRLHGTSNPSLRCRTNPSSPKSKRSSISTPASDDGGMGMGRNPRRVFQSLSEPSSPRSPSKFALFKASFLGISRVSRCGVCSQSVRTGDAAAVFTAECSHSFHLLCITPNAALVCPVCSAIWRHSPLARPDDGPGGKGGEGHAAAQPDQHRHQHRHRNRRPDMDSKRSNSSSERGGESTKPTTAAAKVYDDDEPLLLSGAVRFNPIPEADDEEEDSREDKQGGGGAFPMAMDKPKRCYPRHHPPSDGSGGGGGGVAVCVMPDATLISAGRSHRNYVITLKVRAPPHTTAAADPSLRAPIDLVTVLDVRGSMTGAKLHMLKRAMRQLVSSLGPRDRLSMVVFSSNVAKRLLPLQRMSRQGQRSARQIVDRLIAVSIKQGDGAGDGDGAALALRKATKVLEDRRECNPVATIMLLSDGQQSNADDKRRSTRFAHLEIPIHASGPGNAQMQQGCLPSPSPSPSEPEGNPFNQCVLGGLLSTIFRDVRLQFALPASAGEISAVYSSCEGGIGSGSGIGRAVAVVLEGDCFRLGDLHAGEERDLLVELRVPADGGGPMTMSMSVRCSYRNAVTLELIRGREQVVPIPPPSTSSSSSSLRLRNLFVASRAIVESRRVDIATAHHLLSSARSLLLLHPDEDLLLGLEAALLDLHRLRHTGQAPPPPSAAFDDRRDALTPMSAWRAAERLAKLAIMRKSLNRVSDLHGFENARF